MKFYVDKIRFKFEGNFHPEGVQRFTWGAQLVSSPFFFFSQNKLEVRFRREGAALARQYISSIV